MQARFDVGGDATAPGRSGIPDAWRTEAVQLGFAHSAWIATRQGDRLLLSAAMIHRDGDAVCRLSRSEGIDEISIGTLLEDGTVLYTCAKPGRLWWLLRWCTVLTPRDRFLCEYVDGTSIARLLEVHGHRVRSAGQLIPTHDRRAYLALYARYDEIADPRLARQERIARQTGRGLGCVCGVAAGWAAVSLGVPPVAALVLALIALPVGDFVFGVFTLLAVAPFLVRRMPSPPARLASELLGSIMDIPSASLAELATTRNANEDGDAVPISLPRVELARLRRADVVVTTANALVLPVAVLVALHRLGEAGMWSVLGVLLTLNGFIRWATKRSRAALVREKLLPQLVLLESMSSGAACTASPTVLPSVELVLGLTSLEAARHELAQSWRAPPAWLVVAWIGVVGLLLVATVAQTHRRHERLWS